MARTRSIKPGFFDNELLGCLPPLTRLLFIGLWCQADREGRLEDRPRKLKKTILGYDDVSTDDVDGMLGALEENGFIIRYRAADMDYIQVINFVKHQNPHMKEKASDIPAPPSFEPSQHQKKTGEAPGKHRASTVSEPEKQEEEPEKDGEPPEDTGQPSEGEEQKQSALERRFDMFWTAYPKKRAKEAARKAFKRIKPDEALFFRMMEAIGHAKTSKDWLKEGGQYIPNPATWLNGGCWDDEMTEGGDADGGHSGHHGPRVEQPGKQPGPEPGINGFKPADT